MAAAAPWMLLDQEAHIDYEGRENATTAKAWAAGVSESVWVTFFAADPPLLSHFCVHVPGVTRASAFLGAPSIMYAEDDLALLRVTFNCGDYSEYFFYRAARRRRPRLQYLKSGGSYLRKVNVASMGVLPQRGGFFVLAALTFRLLGRQCVLHVFRSEQNTWVSNALPYAICDVCVIDKVVDLGRGRLGFVDLRMGILVCDVPQEELSAQYIMFPKFLPNNQSCDWERHGRWFRDAIVCSDGSIKCVEVETFLRLVPNFLLKKKFLPQDQGAYLMMYLVLMCSMT